MLPESKPEGRAASAARRAQRGAAERRSEDWPGLLVHRDAPAIE